MNEQIKRKLFDLEIDPPGKTWNKISAALDDEVVAEFPSQLYDFELQPPPKVWNAVATSLAYSDKLNNLELEPPISAWQKISAALEEEKVVPRITPVRRMPVWKYAVAASLLAFVGFGVKWLTAKRVGPEIANQKIVTPKTEIQTKKQDEQQNAVATTTNEQKPQEETPALTNNLPKEGPRQTVIAVTSQKNSYRRPGNYMTAAYKIQMDEFANPDVFCLTNLKTNVPGQQPKFSDAAYRYLVFENDNCELIRISKKLAEKLGCNLPDQNTPEYQNCIQQLKKWSEKIAQVNITPSADNFMNIFELLKSTEEKQF